MKRQNQAGPALLGEQPVPREFTAQEIADGMTAGTVALVDTRGVDEVHAGAVPGALSLPSLGKAATHIGWAFDPETDPAQLVVLAADAAEAAQWGDRFVRVGVDALTGFTSDLEGLPHEAPALVAPADLAALQEAEPDALLLDVRGRGEHAAGSIPGASQLNAGKVLFHQDRLPAPGTARVITFCQSGLRNTVAASALRRAGHDVVELDGSYAGWSRWGAGQV